MRKKKKEKNKKKKELPDSIGVGGGYQHLIKGGRERKRGREEKVREGCERLRGFHFLI